MPIQLSDELLVQLQSSADEAGKVSFTGIGTLDAEGKMLDIEAINDVPVAYAEKSDDSEGMMEEGMSEGMMEGDGPSKAKGGSAIIMAFKKAAGKE